MIDPAEINQQSIDGDSEVETPKTANSSNETDDGVIGNDGSQKEKEDRFKDIKAQVEAIMTREFSTPEERVNAVVDFLSQKFAELGNPEEMQQLIAQYAEKLKQSGKPEDKNNAEFFELLKKETAKGVVESIAKILSTISPENLQKAQELLQKAVFTSEPIDINTFIENEALNTSKLQEFVEKHINPAAVVKEAVLGDEFTKQLQRLKQKFNNSLVGRELSQARDTASFVEELLNEASPMDLLEFMFRANVGYDGSRFAREKYGEKDPDNKEKKTIDILKEVLDSKDRSVVFYSEFFRKDDNSIPPQGEWLQLIAEAFVSTNDDEKKKRIERAKQKMVLAFKKVAESVPGLTNLTNIQETDVVITADVIMLLGLGVEKTIKEAGDK